MAIKDITQDVKRLNQQVEECKRLHDPINHPRHYTNSPAHCSTCGKQIEQIDITQHMGFSIGNVVKYLWRYADKNGLEDLKKAKWYLDHHIQMLEDKEKAAEVRS